MIRFFSKRKLVNKKYKVTLKLREEGKTGKKIIDSALSE